jgi:site-specific recombinase XerD
MSRAKPESLFTLTQSFFHNYLQGTRGASAHTLRAYRDALKLFFLFLADRKHKAVADLSLEDVQAETVLAFLDHIEAKRSNSAVTRNCRLAAVRSFVQHLLRQDVTRAGQYSRILAIRTKRATRRTVNYLEPEEARAVIAAIDLHSPCGNRDHALLLFLYNTGARVSEALSLRACDLRLDRPRQVRLLGKGRKERICPLWPETASVATTHHPRRQERGLPLHQRPRNTADPGWRCVPAVQVCAARRGTHPCATKTECYAARHAPQLRRRASPGGCRRFCHSRLPGPCISSYHQPVHHNQPSDETRSP